jgi:hypothetical protein
LRPRRAGCYHQVYIRQRGEGVPTALLEIVDLGDGEIVLQRAGSDSEPLVSIRFSEESRVFIVDQGLEVARAMIHAGLQAVAQLSDQVAVDLEEEPAAARSRRTVH